jgi:hypothetical protein
MKRSIMIHGNDQHPAKVFSLACFKLLNRLGARHLSFNTGFMLSYNEC